MTTSAKVVQLFHIAMLKWVNHEVVFFLDPSKLTQKQAAYGNNLQTTLALFRLVTTMNTIAALEGYSTSKVMNDCFMRN